jgi:predicted NAD/FAD-dependent oxidoreductase
MSIHIHHFKSNGETVTMVGSGAVWEGYQAEMDYFTFHAERFARFVEAEAKPTIVYQADDQVYGFRRQSQACDGAFAEIGQSETPIFLRELMEDLF